MIILECVLYIIVISVSAGVGALVANLIFGIGE